MHRRELLRTAGLAFAASACPLWIERAFAQEPETGRKCKALELALVRAKELGKPLLVFAVPTDAEMYKRRSLLASLLPNGTDDLLASLALAEVVCVRSDVASKFAKDGDAAAVAYVIEQEPQFVVQSIAVALDAEPVHVHGTEEDSLAIARRWFAPLSDRLRAAIVGDAAHLAKLAAVNYAKLDFATRHAIHRDVWIECTPNRARVDRGAAQYYAQMVTSSVARECWLPYLASAAYARLVDGAPAGASWVSDSARNPCAGGPCGTGSISSASRRMLFFLTNED